jgi:hypothetical protein
MWTALILVVVLTGCTKTVQIQTLQRDELGPAALCDWRDGQPYDCVADYKRSTINLDYLQEILDTLEQYQDEEYNRRKL